VRQDLLSDARGVERWTDIIATPVRKLLADKVLHRRLQS
jgi:predicted N-formylglutamate amidohydrolase